VVFSSTVPDLGVSLHTVYGGAEGADTAITQLTLTRHGARQQLQQVPRDAIPVTHARDRCLLDHLHRLRDALQAEAPDAVVAIDAGEPALAAAADAWAHGP